MAITQKSSRNTTRLILRNKKNEDLLVEDVEALIAEVNDITDGTINTSNLELDGYLAVDAIGEFTTNSGVTVEGVLLKDGEVTTDTINENTASAGVTIDGALIKDGGISDAGEEYFMGVFPVAGMQNLTGPSAINVTSYNSIFRSTGTGDALTLVNGIIPGQLKKVSYIVETNSSDTGILTPSNPGGYATITFNNVGDYVILIWTGTNWNVIENVGVTVA